MLKAAIVLTFIATKSMVSRAFTCAVLSATTWEDFSAAACSVVMACN